jgi:hypothetical protein
LDLEAQKLCTTILPWGKYQYKRLPMGVKTSPDIFQRIMYELLGDIPNIQFYLDDILMMDPLVVARQWYMMRLMHPHHNRLLFIFRLLCPRC